MHPAFYILAFVYVVLMLFGKREDKTLDSPALHFVCLAAALAGILMFPFAVTVSESAAYCNVAAAFTSLVSAYSKKVIPIALLAKGAELAIVLFLMQE